MQKMFV